MIVLLGFCFVIAALVISYEVLKFLIGLLLILGLALAICVMVLYMDVVGFTICSMALTGVLHMCFDKF